MNNGQSISHLWHYFPSLPMGLEEEYRDLRQPAAFSLYLDQMVSPGHKELNPKSASISTSAKRPHFPSSFQAVLKSWLIFPKHEKNSNITESRSWDRWNRWCLHQCVSMQSRLLHSPSLKAKGLSVGCETWVVLLAVWLLDPNTVLRAILNSGSFWCFYEVIMGPCWTYMFENI